MELKEVLEKIEKGEIVCLGVTSLPLPKLCPFFSRRAKDVCTLKHRKVTHKITGGFTYSDLSYQVSRYCCESSWIGQGYLHCAAFTHEYWKRQGLLKNKDLEEGVDG